MKFLKFFLFTATLITVVACSSDDDGGGPTVIELNNANLAGTYEVTFYEGSVISTITASDGSNVVLETETFTTDTFSDAEFTFNEDGTYTGSGNYRITYVLTISGQAPETETDIESFDTQGSYSLNSTTRTITFDFDSVEDVTFFDGNSLTIKGGDVDTFEGITDTEEYEIRLVRIE
jgi:hypothetical protein